MIVTAFIPAFDKIPGLFYTLFFTLATSVLAKRFQGDLIDEHITNSGKIYSTGKAVAVCRISLAILLSIALGAYFLADSVESLGI